MSITFATTPTDVPRDRWGREAVAALPGWLVPPCEEHA